MENVLRYKEFIGSVSYSAEDRVFHGKIEFITDLVTFEGSNVDELENAFTEAVDDYISLCELTEKKPQKSFKGSFNIRMQPELHRKAAITSLEQGVSLNQLVNEAVAQYLRKQ